MTILYIKRLPNNGTDVDLCRPMRLETKFSYSVFCLWSGFRVL